MKERLSRIWFGASCIYFVIGMFLALPYFNWAYARQHGFTSWILFGEIIASSKALIWPYYFVSECILHSERPQDGDRVHYTNSKHACDQALQIVARFSGVSNLPAGESLEVATLLEAAISEARLVNEDYLNRVHPEFCEKYRAAYITSLFLIADGIRTGDPSKQISGAASFNTFADWIRTHRSQLQFPVGL